MGDFYLLKIFLAFFWIFTVGAYYSDNQKRQEFFSSFAKSDLNSYICSASQSVLSIRRSKIHKICLHDSSSGWNSPIHSFKNRISTKGWYYSTIVPVLGDFISSGRGVRILYHSSTGRTEGAETRWWFTNPMSSSFWVHGWTALPRFLHGSVCSCD
jgi:hypothetical protein